MSYRQNSKRETCYQSNSLCVKYIYFLLVRPCFDTAPLHAVIVASCQPVVATLNKTAERPSPSTRHLINRAPAASLRNALQAANFSPLVCTVSTSIKHVARLVFPLLCLIYQRKNPPGIRKEAHVLPRPQMPFGSINKDTTN